MLQWPKANGSILALGVAVTLRAPWYFLSPDKPPIWLVFGPKSVTFYYGSAAGAASAWPWCWRSVDARYSRAAHPRIYARTARIQTSPRHTRLCSGSQLNIVYSILAAAPACIKKLVQPVPLSGPPLGALAVTRPSMCAMSAATLSSSCKNRAKNRGPRASQISKISRHYYSPL